MHICVCICTYKRPELLKGLLDALSTQHTNNRFTYSIVIADNDKSETGRPVANEYAANPKVCVKYCVEPRQNIALARNKAVANSIGQFVAFIDDDELPNQDWLLTLFTTCEQFEADGVLGPVKRRFDERPPKWLLKSHLYERPVCPTGSVVAWHEARTGNVLLRKHIFEGGEAPFRPEFRAGEDQDFFRRMIDRGYVFIWSADGAVYELVPRARWKRRYMLKKALLRGATARLQPSCGPLSIAKSALAVPAYGTLLPFALLLGQHKFVTLMVKICDHLGKILAVLGINPIQQEYVLDE